MAGALCSQERSPTAQPCARTCSHPAGGGAGKTIWGCPGFFLPSQRGISIRTPQSLGAAFRAKPHYCPWGYSSPKVGGSPDISWVLRTANIHLLPDRWSVLLGYQSGSADKAPCQRSPVGMAGCRWGLRRKCPQPMATSRSLLRREQLLAGLRPPCDILRPPVLELFPGVVPSTSASGWWKG